MYGHRLGGPVAHGCQREIEREVEMTRHTHAIVAAIEDLVAVALEAKLEAEIALYRLRQRQNGMALEEAETALLFVVVRLAKMIDILHQARRGPHAYKRDQAEDLQRGTR